MLHIFSESLQEAQRLIKYNWHGDLGQFLFHKKMETVMSHRHVKLTCCHFYLTCSWEGSNRKQQPMKFNQYEFNFTNLSRAPNDMEYIVFGMEGNTKTIQTLSLTSRNPRSGEHQMMYINKSALDQNQEMGRNVMWTQKTKIFTVS